MLSLIDCAFKHGFPEQYAVYVLYIVYIYTIFIYYIYCVCKTFFHGNGQVHRDVKAAYFMLDLNGNVMLPDYGKMGWMVEGGWDRRTPPDLCWHALLDGAGDHEASVRL